MRRTTIYLEPELEVLLKLEMLRQKRPMAEIVREAVQAYVTREPRKAPPGAGAFASGRSDTAGRVDEILAATGFGAPARTRAVRSARKKKR
ncbi:MAG TPA: hypothetical protein VIK60_00930 [Vicinamibacterales bacterium]